MAETIGVRVLEVRSGQEQTRRAPSGDVCLSPKADIATQVCATFSRGVAAQGQVPPGGLLADQLSLACPLRCPPASRHYPRLRRGFAGAQSTLGAVADAKATGMTA